MPTRKPDPRQNVLEMGPQFGAKFMTDHAGQVITNPFLAITELIANAYDAGARNVDINWPLDSAGKFIIQDDGSGMLLNEFQHRWRTLSYDRLKEQGEIVEFPPGAPTPKRTHLDGTAKVGMLLSILLTNTRSESRKAGASSERPSP